MPDARVMRPVPGVDVRPGDLLVRTTHGLVLARPLTSDEVEAIMSHPSAVAWFSALPHAELLPPSPAPLRLVR